VSEVGRARAPSRAVTGAARPLGWLGAVVLAVAAVALPVRATAELFAVIQGLVILFCGALEFMFQPLFAGWFKVRQSPRTG
jgi:hypothetical protein